MADAMLVTMQNDPIISLTLPGKIQSYMAAGKPIIGAINGEAQRVIEESMCGMCANAEDFEGLADCARKYFEAHDINMSENSRGYCSKYFSKELFVRKLEEILTDACIND